jgi:hypothetical protein
MAGTRAARQPGRRFLRATSDDLPARRTGPTLCASHLAGHRAMSGQPCEQASDVSSMPFGSWIVAVVEASVDDVANPIDRSLLAHNAPAVLRRSRHR